MGPYKPLRTWVDEFPSPIIWVFPKIGVPQNGRFIMENLVKIHDLVRTPIVILLLETPIWK